MSNPRLNTIKPSTQNELKQPPQDMRHQELYESIYNTAKNGNAIKKNELRLSTKNQPYAKIDALQQWVYGEKTPASKLIEEGNESAVSFLIQLGANINPIAREAASVGNIKFVESLYTKSDLTMITMIVEGLIKSDLIKDEKATLAMLVSITNNEFRKDLSIELNKCEGFIQNSHSFITSKSYKEKILLIRHVYGNKLLPFDTQNILQIANEIVYLMKTYEACEITFDEAYAWALADRKNPPQLSTKELENLNRKIAFFSQQDALLKDLTDYINSNNTAYSLYLKFFDDDATRLKKSVESLLSDESHLLSILEKTLDIKPQSSAQEEKHSNQSKLIDNDPFKQLLYKHYNLIYKFLLCTKESQSKKFENFSMSHRS